MAAAAHAGGVRRRAGAAGGGGGRRLLVPPRHGRLFRRRGSVSGDEQDLHSSRVAELRRISIGAGAGGVQPDLNVVSTPARQQAEDDELERPLSRKVSIICTYWCSIAHIDTLSFLKIQIHYLLFIHITNLGLHIYVFADAL